MKKRILAMLLCLSMAMQMTSYVGAGDEYIEDVPLFDVIEDGEIIQMYDEYPDEPSEETEEIEIIEEITEDDIVIGEIEDEAETEEVEETEEAPEAEVEAEEIEEIEIIEEDDVILEIIESEADTFWSNGEEESNDTFLSDDSELVTVSGKLPEDGRVVFSEVSNEFSELLAELEQSQSRITFDLNEGSSEKIPVWSGVYDIKILDSDNVEWQPTEAVNVTIGNIYPNEHEVIEVYHYLNSAEEINTAMAAFENGEIEMGYYEAAELSELFPTETAAAYEVLGMEDCICYTVISSENGMVEINDDGSISFETNGFSIYKVSASFDITETDTQELISEANKPANVSIPVNDTVYYMWKLNEQLTVDTRGVWAVTEGTDIIEITTYDDNRLGKDTVEKNECGDECKVLHLDSCPLAPGKQTECECNSNIVHLKKCSQKEKCTCGEKIIIQHITTCENSVPEASYDYWYVKVKALKEGQATLTFVYYENNGNDSVGDDRTVYTINITVSPKNNQFWIEDQVAENGCLVPMYNGNETIATYEWKKTIGGEILAIDQTAYHTIDGKQCINIAIDKGGVENSDLKEKKYTVIAKDADGNQIGDEAEFTVKYGNEILNGSFEEPVISYDLSHEQFSNGEPGLYWMTTGTGAIRDDADKLGHDIEIFTDINGGLLKTYGGTRLTKGVNKVADGHQGAELNCEEYGALYQDVLTNPGATLQWSVAQKARFAGKNAKDLSDSEDSPEAKAAHNNYHMCVIIMSTEDARSIITKADIDELLINAGYGGSTTSNPVYEESSTANDDGYYPCGFSTSEEPHMYTIQKNGKSISYYIYECCADYTKWKSYQGTYTVPAGQYLTRFFFAATVSVTDNLAGGNMIDAVSFSEELKYTIEYYVQQNDGTYVELYELEEGEEVSVGTMVSATKTTSSALEDYDLFRTVLNGEDYHKNTSFEVRTLHESKAPTLKLYYNLKRTSLTLEKKGSQENLDPNQTFVFTINGSDLKTEHIQDLQVVIKGNGKVTIADLPIGKYTIEEESGWSWRYTPDATIKDKTIQVGADNTVIFDNARKDIPWLDGNAYCINTFDPEVAAEKFPDSKKNEDEEVNP